MTPTTFLSFTAEGGRLGRIAWSNGDDNTWGHIRWDNWWPSQPQLTTPMAKAFAHIRQATLEIHQAGVLMAQALRPAVEQATDAILAFSTAMAKAQAKMSETHETQDEIAP
jgi:hypothetical protein